MSNNGLEDFDSFLNEASEKLSPQAPSAPVPTPVPQKRPGNEVFSEQQPQVPEQQSAVSKQQEYAKSQFGIEIPVDAVPLPSGGKLYPHGHPLHLAEHVEYKAMTAKEEDILTNVAFLKKGTVINELIKSCMLNRGIDVNSLVSGDRNAIMIAIRISGYGREYETDFLCPACEYKNKLVVDLANLNLKPLDLTPDVAGENLFSFKLPISGHKVQFKFLTGKEEEEILRNAEARKKQGLQFANNVTSRLSQVIVSIEGDSSQKKILGYVQNMRAGDSKALREYIDTHEPGVDMEVEFTCTTCDHYAKIQLPLGSNFFWPGTQR